MPRAAWWVLLGCLAAGDAVAQPYPTVTAFPLELKRTPAGFSEDDHLALDAEFERLLRKAGAEVPDSALYAQALQDLKRRDCDVDDECLKQLAQLARTLYALYAQVDTTLSGNVVAMGRVVRSDGVPMGKTRTVSLPRGKKPFAQVASAALERLLGELGVADLPPQRTLVADPPRVAAPGPGATALPPPLPPPPPPPAAVTPPAAVATAPARPGLRRYAWLPGVVAGVAGAGAGVTWGLAFDAHQQLSTRTWPNGAQPAAAAQRGEALQLASAVSLGAAVAAAGVFIWFLASGDMPAAPAPSIPPAPPAASEPPATPAAPAPAPEARAW